MSEPEAPAPAAAMDLVEMTSELVSAYVAKNSVPAAELPALIVTIHGALGDLGKPSQPEVTAETLKPAVPVRKSITDEYIISLEDGRKLKSLKRYLGTLGMTPAEYRAKWGLPQDYPMVAPAYAAQRSELAKSLGLGRRGAQEATEAAPDADLEADEAPVADGAKTSRKRGTKGA